MLLVLVIISSILCLALSLFMFSSKGQSFPFSKGIGIYFTFEAVWQMLTHIVTGIWPNSDIMQITHYTFTAIMAVIVFYAYLVAKKTTSKNPKDKDR